MLKIGESAPEFALRNQKGELISLSEILKSKKAVVYFYPKDETAGCTAEACSFRDNYEDFLNLGAEVIGISKDDTEKHSSFASNHRLPFQLLSDSDGAVAKLYKVPKTLGFIAGRVTYVIDQDKKILCAFNSQFQVLLHVQEAKEALQAH
jgi:peroxiredoxin Q/BCP